MAGFGGFGSNTGTGFNFGTNKTTAVTTPIFSSASTSGGSFTLGTPQPTATTGLNLGASFINTSATTSTPSFNFGPPKTTASSGISLGTPAATQGGFNFGSTPSSTSLPAFSLGALTTSAAPAPTLGLSFGQPATSQLAGPDLSLGAPKTTSQLTFGTSATTQSGSFGFNLGGQTAPATTTTPSLNFGISSNFGTGGGLFGANKTTSNLTLSTATTTTTIGLGGVDNSQLKKGLSAVGTSEPKQVKDNVLPEPLLQSLNDFQAFIKQQKSLCVEISHSGSKSLKKVQEDTQALKTLLSTITNGLTRNWLAVEKLKNETAQGLHQAEMAQRLRETPPGLQYETTASIEYFNELITKFEQDSMKLRVQMETSEKHLQSLEQSSSLSPEELTLAIRRLHETLVVLAAKVQTLHTAVQSRKEQYCNLRRVYTKDDLVSSVINRHHHEGRKLHSLTGPTSFSDAPLRTNINILPGSAISTSGWAGNLDTSALSTSLSAPITLQPVDNTGFQLAKPPLGNKRNKR